MRWIFVSLMLVGCTDRATSTTMGEGSQDGTGGGAESEASSVGEAASSTTTTTSTSSSSESTAAPVVCDNPAFQCDPIECDADTCGGVEAWFDDDGCLRPSCGGHEDCGPDFACYRGTSFGVCISGGIYCEEMQGECVCGADPDCGGSHCVPVDIYPVPFEPGPMGPGRAQRLCNVYDGLALTFTADPIACGEDAPPLLRIEITHYSPGNVQYGIGPENTAVDDAGVPATGGQFSLDAENDGLLSGEYDLVFDDYEIYGSFTDLPICPCA